MRHLQPKSISSPKVQVYFACFSSPPPSPWHGCPPLSDTAPTVEERIQARSRSVLHPEHHGKHGRLEVSDGRGAGVRHTAPDRPSATLCRRATRGRTGTRILRRGECGVCWICRWCYWCCRSVLCWKDIVASCRYLGRLLLLSWSSVLRLRGCVGFNGFFSDESRPPPGLGLLMIKVQYVVA